VKYAFIQCHKRIWPIRVQCRVLGVSVSGYHQHSARRKELARRHLSDEALLVHIRAVYAESHGAYGWPRIWRQLRAQGIRVGKRVQRLMQKHGIRARGKRRFRVTTTDSWHNLPVAPNLLNRNFAPAASIRRCRSRVPFRHAGVCIPESSETCLLAALPKEPFDFPIRTKVLLFMVR
jgi:putative transposase